MYEVNGLLRGRRRVVTTAAVLILLVIAALPAMAITHGEPDGNGHPNVGAIVVDIPGEGLMQICSGTLIAPTVFLTATHCTVYLDELLPANPGAQMLVTFDPTIDPAGTFYTGDYYGNPAYNGLLNGGGGGPGGHSDLHDVAVILLDSAPPGITPASLPTAGLLDQLQADHVLKDTRFTAVGYGAVRETNQTGFAGILANLDRNRAEQGFLALTPAWLTLPMTPANGNGGTCYGDSGGPHFIHLDGVETDIVASITVTGDMPCVATDKTYRIDTESARSFLGQFVALP